MTEHRTPDPLAALDQRGRAAAAGVRAAVAERPIPAFEADLVRIDLDARPAGERRRPNRPLVGLLAAAAAVLVVVAMVVAFAGTGPDDSAPTDEVTPGDRGRYRLATVPEGYALTGVQDGVEDGDAGLGDATVYGPNADTPLLAVAVMRNADPCDLPDAEEGCVPDPDAVPSAAMGMEPIDIGGRRAWDAGLVLGGHAVLVEVGDQVVLVAGAPAGPEGVRAAAAVVEVDGDRAIVPPSGLPEGSRSLGLPPLQTVLGIYGGVVGPIAGFDPGPSWAVWYQRGAGSDIDGLIVLDVRAGGPLDRSLPALMADEVEPVSVRGHDAVLVRTRLGQQQPPVDWWSLRWEERPGEVVEIRSFGGDEGDDGRGLLAWAEAMEPVAADDVDDLRTQVAERGLDAPGVTVLARGTASDGTDWILSHGAPDSELGLTSGIDLRFGGVVSGYSANLGGSGELIEGEGGEGEEPDEEEPPPAGLQGEWATVTAGSVSWAFGPAAPEVAAVEIRTVDDVLVVEATVYEVDGIKAWLTELPPSVDPSEGDADEVLVVALDADGDEVDRQTL